MKKIIYCSLLALGLVFSMDAYGKKKDKKGNKKNPVVQTIRQGGPVEEPNIKNAKDKKDKEKSEKYGDESITETSDNNSGLTAEAKLDEFKKLNINERTETLARSLSKAFHQIAEIKNEIEGIKNKSKKPPKKPSKNQIFNSKGFPYEGGEDLRTVNPGPSVYSNQQPSYEYWQSGDGYQNQQPGDGYQNQQPGSEYWQSDDGYQNW